MSRKSHRRGFTLVTWLTICLAAACAGEARAADADTEVLQFDFEQEAEGLNDFTFRLGSGAELSTEAKYAGERSLKGVGENVARQYIGAFDRIKVKPGSVYGIHFRYKTSKTFPKNNMLVHVHAGQDEVIRYRPLRVAADDIWQNKWLQFRVPDDAETITLRLRFANVPESESIYIDDFSITNVADPYAGFTMDFRNWADPYKNLILWRGGYVEQFPVGSTIGAYSGEECLVLEGRNDYHQYSARIEEVWVKPDTPYELSFYYRTTEDFSGAGPSASVVLYQWGEDGRLIQNGGFTSYDFTPIPSTDWNKATFQILPEEETHKLWIALRLIKVMSPAKIYIDQIEFRESQPLVFLEHEIDPATNVLSGQIQATAGMTVDHFKVTLRKYDAEKDERPLPQRVEGEWKHTDFTIREYGEIVKVVELPADESNFSIDLSSYADGGYTISGEAVSADGDVIATKDTIKSSVFYLFKDRYWEGNDIGTLGDSESPPPPWTPLSVNASQRTVASWNNELSLRPDLTFADYMFLDEGTSLLQAPMEFMLNGQDFLSAFEFEAPKLLFRSPHTVTFGSQGASSDFDVEIELSVEFDGFAKYTIEFIPKRDTAVDDLSVVLRNPAGFIRYVEMPGWREKYFFTDGNTWEANEFFSWLWFGNFDTGIAWAANQISPAKQRHDEAWVEIRKTDGGDEIRIHPVNDRVELQAGEPLKAEFAFIPTPTRPKLKSFRPLRFRAEEHSNFDLLWHQPQYFRDSGFPVASSPENLHRKLEESEAQGIRLAFYLAAAYASDTVPQMTYFRKQWLNHPYNAYAQSERWPGQLEALDLHHKSWADLYCLKLKQFLAEFTFGGLYFDVSAPRLREKEGQYSAPIFEARELHKRIMVLLREVNPDGLIWFHGASPVYSSFADLILHGEHLRGKLLDHDYYLEFASLEQLRGELFFNWGQGIYALGQYRQPAKAEDPRLACHFMGLVMLHDAKVYPNFVKKETVDAMRFKLYEFGDITDAPFFPYWEDNPYLETDNDHLAFSFYEKGGELFVIVLNKSDQQQNGRLTLKERSGYLNDAVVFEPVEEAQRKATLSDGSLDLTLDPYLAQIVVLTKQE